MKSQILPALRLTFVMLGLCCVLYPALVWGVAQLAPGHGEGVQITRNGRVVGFANVGQKFDRPEYFNSRPSAADYHADASSGSNKGPSNPEYLATVKARLDTFLLHNPGVQAADVPSELLTASGSGLDPHLSPQGALVQVPRVARARNLSASQVQALVAQHIETSLFGPDKVNVLQLNLALAMLCTSAALAQTTSTTDPALAVPAPVAPAPPAPPTSPLTTYGFVDAYYGFDFDHGNTNQRPGFFYSHNRQNEFTVNNAILGARYDDGKVRGAFGIHAGTYVSANYAAEDQVLKHIYEAYAGFRPFNKAWLDLGIFGSHIGFESAISKDNWTLTRSLMAENSPYYEAGARLTYEVAPKLTLTGLALNGWQNIRENNQGKALGTQIQWKPTDKLLINSSTFYGNEQPQDSLKRRRYFHDFYLTYAASDRLSLAVVFDVGKQQSQDRSGYDSWHTGAAFVKVKLADKFSTTLRGEYYDADRGVIISSISPRRTDARFLAGGTSLNFDYLPTANLAFRVEGRYLRAQSPILQHDFGTSQNYGNVTTSVALSF